MGFLSSFSQCSSKIILGVPQVQPTLPQDGYGLMWAAWSPPCWPLSWFFTGKRCILTPTVWMSLCTVSPLHRELWGKVLPLRRDYWRCTSDPCLDMMCLMCQLCFLGSLSRWWAFSYNTQTRGGVWFFMKPWHRPFTVWTEAVLVNHYLCFIRQTLTMSKCQWDHQCCWNNG